MHLEQRTVLSALVEFVNYYPLLTLTLFCLFSFLVTLVLIFIPRFLTYLPL